MRYVVILLLGLIFVPGRLVGGQDLNWPQFRGPRGDGVSTSAGLPLEWSETDKVRWKTPIRGRAWSSPVVWGDQVWVSSATENGEELFALCVNLETGSVARELNLFRVEEPQFAHKFNTYASPTPVIEEGRLYVTYGSPGTACVDTRTGRVLWERRDLECNHYRGAGSSPILYGDLLIVNHDGSDHQYVIALDKQTGRTVWRTDRSINFDDLGPDGKPVMEGDLRKAFATCHVATFDDRPVLISQGAKAVYGYDPLTGGELWRVEERTAHSASSRVATGNGLVFAPSGWARGQLVAFRPPRPGVVFDANRPSDPDAQPWLAWVARRSVPRKPSLTFYRGLLFGLDDGGIATCWDAGTGEVFWNERVGGNYSASPLIAEERIYVMSEEGKVTVLAAGKVYRKLAENDMEGGFMASPAVSGASLVLRSKTHLYLIREGED